MIERSVKLTMGEYAALGQLVATSDSTVRLHKNLFSKWKDFPEWKECFIEFSKFGDFKVSDKSLKHELGSI